MKFWILIAALLIKNSHSITVECEFEDDQWGGGKYGYQCFVKSINITSKSDRTITEVTGKHINGRSNCDVVQFDCRVSNVSYLPLDLKKFFPNLETLVFANGANLKELSAEELKPFGEKLRHLFLGENLFEIIDFDLFRYTPNLERIQMYDIPLKHIDNGAFDNLPKLSALLLKKCSCVDEEIAEDRVSTLKLIRTAERNCKDPSIAKERDEIQRLKYEVQKTQGLLGYELETGILEIQKRVFDVYNRTSYQSKIDQCSEVESATLTVDKTREIINQFLKLKKEQIQVWTRAKNEVNLLLSNLPLYCTNSNPNCIAILDELKQLDSVLNSVQSVHEKVKNRKVDDTHNFQIGLSNYATNRNQRKFSSHQ